MRSFKIIISVVLLACALTAKSNNISIKATLDSTTIQMGRIATMNLEVSQPKNIKGSFPIFNKIVEKGYVGLCGDSVEMHAPTKIDSIIQGGRLTLKLNIPIQSFDSGFYSLQKIAYVVGSDTTFSNELALKVVPVKATANDPIHPYAGIAKPVGFSIFDYLPLWMLTGWFILALVAVLVVLAILLWKKYRRDGSLIPQKPEPTPYEKAISSLQELKEAKLWENGMEKEYFTLLTEIFRNYLYGRFGINAMEMTSRQILASVSKNDVIKDRRNEIRLILDMADFAKFAKVKPLANDCIQSYDIVKDFVDSTKPVMTENTEGKEVKNDI